MAEAGLQVIQPASWPRPRGYVNGMVTAGEGERILFVAGQIGWDSDGTFATDDFVEQFARALDNLLEVVGAAGGAPSSIAQMTIYVTDLAEYRASTKAIGEVWRVRFGQHYPAMALIGVAALLEPRAKVEVEATCALSREQHPPADTRAR